MISSTVLPMVIEERRIDEELEATVSLESW
jgi:hypothetical protein